MTKSCTWLLAVASLLGLAGTTYADLPALSPLLLPVLFGQESPYSPPPAQTAPVPNQRLEIRYPTQWNGVLSNGQPAYAVPVPANLQNMCMEADSEDDQLIDMFWDCIDTVRMLVLWRPASPYQVAAGAVLQYLQAMDAAQRETRVVVEPLHAPAACAKDGPCRQCEVLPYPKAVDANSGDQFSIKLGYNTAYGFVGGCGCTQAGAAAGGPGCPRNSCEVPYPQPVCPYGCGGYIVGVGPGGLYAIPCGDGCERIGVDFHVPCTKAGFGCGTHLSVPLDSIADACDNGMCGQEVVQCGKASKPCKCCEDCKDCKDCNCKKNTAVKVGNKPVYIQRIIMEPATNGLPMAMPPAPPYPPPFAFGYPLPPGHAMMPPLPPLPDMRNQSPTGYEWGVPPHAMMPPLPPSPMQELAELNWQRAMISAAIEQIEQDLVRIECEKRVVQSQVAHNTQKVHLVTEHFEAHCDGLSCVGGDVHRLMLQGDVRLVCKKSGQAVRIEAPCVVINMKDGTFHVESRPNVVPPAASVQCPYDTQIYSSPPVMPATGWNQANQVQMWRMGVNPVQVPVMPTPAGPHSYPCETLPMPMPCPVSPPWTRPAPRLDDGDK